MQETLHCEPVATLGKPGDDGAVAVYTCQPVTRRAALRTGLLLVPALMVEFIGADNKPR